MTTLIYPESELEVHIAPPKGLQQLLHNPLAALSQLWHSSNFSLAEEEREELPLVQLTGHQQPASPLRLHVNAERCLSSLRAGTASIAIMQDDTNGVNFLDLPVGVHLHIFAFLDARSLCRLAQSCDYMYRLTSDPLLWTHLLKCDVRGWNVIGHLSHPQVYADASSDLSPKQIYCKCQSHCDSLPQQSFAHPITGRLRSLVRRIQGHIPQLLMFGSGLESVPLVRSILWEDDSPYHPIGLYPGKDGVGSGVCIQHRGTPVNLVTLYTATRAEREAAQTGRQARVNKLVTVGSEDQEQGSGGCTELTPAVQELCRHADAFVLVVDACYRTEDARVDMLMLQAMLRSNILQTTPLLVLSCQPSGTQDGAPSSPSLCPPVEVANTLRLCELQQPWQVRSLVLKQYQSLQDGLDWLLGAAKC